MNNVADGFPPANQNLAAGGPGPSQAIPAGDICHRDWVRVMTDIPEADLLSRTHRHSVSLCHQVTIRD